MLKWLFGQRGQRVLSVTEEQLFAERLSVYPFTIGSRVLESPYVRESNSVRALSLDQHLAIVVELRMFGIISCIHSIGNIPNLSKESRQRVVELTLLKCLQQPLLLDEEKQQLADAKSNSPLWKKYEPASTAALVMQARYELYHDLWDRRLKAGQKNGILPETALNVVKCALLEYKPEHDPLMLVVGNAILNIRAWMMPAAPDVMKGM
jgi:hypothetical protein